MPIQIAKGLIWKLGKVFTDGLALATEAFVTAAIAASDSGAKGSINCSANPNYPAANAGDRYRVSVGGKIGGASGDPVEVGDIILCWVDGSAAGTKAAVGANWTIEQGNLLAAPRGNSASYPKTTAGDQTLLPAAAVDRAVQVTVEVTEVFAAGDGAAPIFDVGETDTPEKFKANMNTGALGSTFSFGGILLSGKALLIGATAATGTTSTGAIKVTAVAVPTA